MSIRAAASHTLERYGLNPRQLTTLLGVYIKQDLRGGKSFLNLNKREYITSNWALLTIIVVYALLGLMLGLVALNGKSVFIHSVIALSFTFFLVALALIAESDNIIFNEAEVDVIGHLPISPRTHFAAKILNLLLFSLLIAAVLNFFPAVLGVFAAQSKISFVFAHALSAALVSMFVTALIVISHGLLIRLVTRRQFNNLVAYSQAALTLIFMFGYQLMPRLVDKEQLPTATEAHWYYLLYPPAWFSGITMLLVAEFDVRWLAMATLGLASLLGLGVAACHRVALGHSSHASQLAYRPSEMKAGREPGQDLISPRPLTYVRRSLLFVKAGFLPRPTERAVFELVSTYLKRDREVKARLYPLLAYMVFVPLLGIVTGRLSDPFAGRGSPFYALLGAEMICFIALMVVESLVFSGHYQAAYIFQVAPIGDHRDVYSGFRKAIILYSVLPGFAVLFLLYSVFWGNPLHALLVVAPWVVLTPAVLVFPFLYREVLPLSRKYQKGQQSARNMVTVITNFVGLSLLIVIQGLGAKGYFPYWLFIVSVAIVSPAGYLVGLKVGSAYRAQPSAKLR
jgi:ABC-2 type transport system permease protein